MAAIEKLSRILATTVPTFLPLEKPISRNANPACMNITRQPATITHIELIAADSGKTPCLAASRLSAWATPGRAAIATVPRASARSTLDFIRELPPCPPATGTAVAGLRLRDHLGASRAEVLYPPVGNKAGRLVQAAQPGTEYGCFVPRSAPARRARHGPLASFRRGARPSPRRGRRRAPRTRSAPAPG